MKKKKFVLFIGVLVAVLLVGAVLMLVVSGQKTVGTSGNKTSEGQSSAADGNGSGTGNSSDNGSGSGTDNGNGSGSGNVDGLDAAAGQEAADGSGVESGKEASAENTSEVIDLFGSSGQDGAEDGEVDGNKAGDASDGKNGISSDRESAASSAKEKEALEKIYEAVSEDRVSVIETEEEGVVTMTFAGDILFDKSYAVYASYLQRGSVLENSMSAELLEKMRAADVMMVNNEFPYTDRGEPTPDKTYTFRAPTDSVSLLDEIGVDIVSLANNHASDYGEISLLDSLDTLDAAGMPYVGAGRNLEEAMQPYYFEADGYVIAVVAATQIERYQNPSTPGATETSAGVFRCYDPTLLLSCIEEAKANSDFVVLFVHWGTESTDELDWAQKSQAPQFVAAGADLIIGDHPHVLQEIGYIDGVPIVYSLGNFWFNSRTLDTCLVTATIRDGELESLQFIPCLQSGCSTSVLEGTEKQRVINYMRSISGTAQIDDDGFVTEK